MISFYNDFLFVLYYPPNFLHLRLLILRNLSNRTLFRVLQSYSSMTFSVNFLDHPCLLLLYFDLLTLFHQTFHPDYRCGTACCPVGLPCPFSSCCFLLSNCQFFSPISQDVLTDMIEHEYLFYYLNLVIDGCLDT